MLIVKRKALALCLFLVIVASIIPLTQLANSETSTTKPSVPEFTVKLVDSSYDVPTTSSMDPYTGENVTHAGYRVESRSIEVTIKNQPFVPYSSGGWNIEFYYNIRIRGHFSEDWIELYRASDGYPTQSDSQNTIISYVLGENNDTILGTKMIEFPPNSQVDFQVEAMIGYVSRVYNPNANGNPLAMYPWVFTGETSGWSGTQTLTIPASSAPEVPEFPSWIILPLLIIVLISVGLVVQFRKRKRQV